MNRFHKAWLALTGRLEPEVRVVPGDVAMGSLYCVEDRQWIGDVYGFDAVVARRWYLTCEQAFAENPGKPVESATAFKIGDEWHVRLTGAQVKVQPKPKRPKGKLA